MGTTIEYDPRLSDQHDKFVSFLRSFRAELRTDRGRSNWKEYGRSSKFHGYELFHEFPEEKPSFNQRQNGDITFVKRDLNDKHRLVMKLRRDKAGTESLVEGKAWIWYHDHRVLKLGDTFFCRANMPE